MGMPHRSGSMPHREIIYENGGKDSKTPDLAEIFLKTRSKNGTLCEKEKEKYDEIVKTVKSNPSLSSLEVAEKHFGPQRHGHVYCFGGGVKRKHFKDSKEVYIRDLEAKLRKKDEENQDLKRRMDMFESRLNIMETGTFSRDQPSTPDNDHRFDEFNGENDE